MNIKNNYACTHTACRISYIVQAITVNFAPLLFLTFMREFSLSLAEISSLIAITFTIQLLVDLLSTEVLDKIGYRTCAVVSHILAVAGFIFLSFLPDLFPNPFTGIIIACLFYSCGSGMIEVMASPIVEACPTHNKASAMAITHSFYCWGTAIVILGSSVFFALFGIENWRILSLLWAIIPGFNMLLFFVVPINKLPGSTNGQRGLRIFDLLKSKFIWLCILLMLCGGAAELAMSQWASAFVEDALSIPKAIGDMAGPFMFAITMGIGRIVYARFLERTDLLKYMLACAVLCLFSYVLSALAPHPVPALLGCALTGFSVGTFWPGTISYAASRYPKGGSAMFSLLAFAGDTGCTLGPSTVGFISGLFGENLKLGLLSVSIFPILMIVGIFLCRKMKNTGM